MALASAAAAPPFRPHHRNSKLCNCTASLPNGPTRFFLPRLGPLFWPWEKVKVGPLSVSPMGFGTWAWGNQLLWGYEEDMDDDLQEIFNLAIRNGINLFDTADSYGTGRLSGQSERLLGKFVREYQGRSKVSDNIVIATKFAAYPWRLTSGQFVRACKSSLERLKLEKIGIGQLHWSTANYAPLQELALWDGLVAMYEKKLKNLKLSLKTWNKEVLGILGLNIASTVKELNQFDELGISGIVVDVNERSLVTKNFWQQIKAKESLLHQKS